MNRTVRQLFRASAALALAALLTVSITGCGRKGQPKEYKIGAILAVTGKASYLGDPEKKTLEMLVRQLNDRGGVNGVRINLMIEDDNSDPDRTLNAAKKLIDRDRVLAMIGPSQSGNTLKIKELVTRKKVPLISCAAAEAIVNPVSPWVFKVPQKDSFVARYIYRDMNRRKIRNIAVLYDGTGFGQEGFRQLDALKNKYGIRIALSESYSPTASKADLKDLLLKTKDQKGIQAVINWSIFDSQSSIPGIMKQLKMDGVQLYQSHGFGNIKYVREAGAAADGTIFPAGRLLVASELPDSAQKSVLLEYKDAYETAFKGEAVSTFGGHAYDAFHILMIALEKAGADREKIREALEDIRFTGTAGVFEFSKEDHNGLGMDSLVMQTVKNGRFTLLK